MTTSDSKPVNPLPMPAMPESVRFVSAQPVPGKARGNSEPMTSEFYSLIWGDCIAD